MRKILFPLIALAAALAAPVDASAQFYQNGDDPFGRWSETGSAHWRILYPEGTDSLARSYLSALEHWRPLVGESIGAAPVSLQGGRMPVVLHTHDPFSNGSVAWAPRRMDLYTHPEAYGSLPQSWVPYTLSPFDILLIYLFVQPFSFRLAISELCLTS